MSWIPRRKEWQKTYMGKRYRVSAKQLASEPTKAGSLIAANDWWEKKRAEIDNNDRVTLAYNEAIDRHECMADWFGEHGDSESQQHSLQQASRLRAILETENVPPMADVWEAFDGVSDLGVRIWQDRINTVQRRRKSVPHDQSLSFHVEAYLASKRTEASANEITVSGYDRYRRHVEYFRDWFGPSNPVTTIDAVKMRNYLAHLKEQIAEREQDPSKGMARWEAKGKLDTAKQFVRSLWEVGLIDLPRNIDNRKFTISVGTSKPQTIPLTDAKLLLAGKAEASEVTCLYVLLCANCGM